MFFFCTTQEKITKIVMCIYSYCERKDIHLAVFQITERTEKETKYRRTNIMTILKNYLHFAL